MELLKALHWRYAVKRFSDKTLSNNQVSKLLDATRLSASSYGLQPYKIIVIKSKKVRRALLPFSFQQDKVVNSSHLLIFAAKTKPIDSLVDDYIAQYLKMTGQESTSLQLFSDNIKSAFADKSSEQCRIWADQQAYLALGNLLTCAADMGIDSCPMSGFDQAGFDAVLTLKEQELSSTVICPIGFRHPEDPSQYRAKIRFDYDDIVMEI